MSSARAPFPVAILLATYDGAAHLQDQLDSLTAQSHDDWRLVVSDDGSTDATRDIVRRFAAARPGRDIALRDGPRQDATRNFLSMLADLRPGEALAFCDQDDVWLPHRLSGGVAALGARDPDRPALHVTRTLLCDETLREIGPAPLFTRPAGFRNALVQACTPGNTMLVNPAGAALLRQGAAAAARAGVVSHDWWAYQLISGAGGTVIRDPGISVLYRQHGANVMGRNDTGRARLARLSRLGAGDYGRWLHANVAALTDSAGLLTGANRTVLDRFAAALALPGPAAAAALRALGVHRQTRAGTLALLAAAAAGRLGRR